MAFYPAKSVYAIEDTTLIPGPEIGNQISSLVGGYQHMAEIKRFVYEANPTSELLDCADYVVISESGQEIRMCYSQQTNTIYCYPMGPTGKIYAAENSNYMFAEHSGSSSYGMENCEYVDVSWFDTSRVITIWNMFHKIKAHTLDLSTFDLSNLNPDYDAWADMFYSESGIREIIAPAKLPQTLEVPLPDCPADAYWILDNDRDGISDDDVHYINMIPSATTPQRYIKEMPSTAILLPGGAATFRDYHTDKRGRHIAIGQFEQAITQTTNLGDPDYIDASDIIAIRWSDAPISIPATNSTTGTDFYGLASTEESNYPITFHAYHINEGIIVELYTSAETVYLSEDCSNLFSYFVNLKDVAFLSSAKINTSYTTNMKAMFQGCRSLKELDLSQFDTSNVTNMASLFASCTSLNTVDLHSFDTANVTSLTGTFLNCKSLQNVDVSSFDTSNVLDMCGCFAGCDSLITLDLSTWDACNIQQSSYKSWDMFFRSTAGYGIRRTCRNLTLLKAPKNMPDVVIYLPLTPNTQWYCTINGHEYKRTRFVHAPESITYTRLGTPPSSNLINPTQISIPITMDVESYYEISVPASIQFSQEPLCVCNETHQLKDGSEEIYQEYASFKTIDNINTKDVIDNAGTYYAFGNISLKGSSSSPIAVGIILPVMQNGSDIVTTQLFDYDNGQTDPITLYYPNIDELDDDAYQAAYEDFYIKWHNFLFTKWYNGRLGVRLFLSAVS